MYGVAPGADSYFPHFGANNNKQIYRQNLKLKCQLLMFI